MPRYLRCFVASVSALLFATIGCGGSKTGVTPAPITGPFSNANFSGPYAFVFSGTSSAGFFAMAGSFQTSGNGNLVSGVMDINNNAGVFTSVPFTGVYNVIPNGQGSATLTSAVQTFNIRFVMISSRRALLTRFDSNSIGHGSIDLQDATAFSPAGIKGQFAYQLTGINAAGNPLASVGGFNTDGVGAVTAGLHDVNDNGTPTTNQPLTGAYTVTAGANGRGTLTLNTSLGILHFAFYVVSAIRMKLVEIERTPALAGEASGGNNGTIDNPGCAPCVFAWNGFSGVTPFAAAGMYGVPSATIDINMGGSVGSSPTVSGTYSFAPQYRGTVNFSSVAGTPANFAIYPSADGLLMLEIDPGKVISGVAVDLAQAGSPHLDLSFDGSFGFNFIGTELNNQVDEVGHVATTNTNGSGPVTGAMDINNAGVPNPGVAISGSFTMDKGASGTLTLQTSAGAQHFRLHALGQFGEVFFVSADSNLVAAGIFEPQAP